jgi:hypothetical protein
MDFETKIKIIIDSLSLSKPFSYQIESTNNYRNKIDFNFKDIFMEYLFPSNFKNIIDNLIILSKLITNYNIYGAIIKESNTHMIMIILKIHSCKNLDNDTKKQIFEFINDRINVDSFYYQINYNLHNHITNHSYYHLFGKINLLNKYSLNNKTILAYNHPYAFCRVNHFISPFIYRSVDNLIIKNKDYTLLTSGRDVNVISQLYHNFYKDTIIFTHCDEVCKDLKDNKYETQVNIIHQDKKNIPQKIIDNTSNESIFILTSSRKGINDDFISALNQTKNIKQVIYMACSHKTVIRDCIKLLPYFSIDKYEYFDEFPNTNYLNINISLVRN